MDEDRKVQGAEDLDREFAVGRIGRVVVVEALLIEPLVTGPRLNFGTGRAQEDDPIEVVGPKEMDIGEQSEFGLDAGEEHGLLSNRQQALQEARFLGKRRTGRSVAEAIGSQVTTGVDDHSRIVDRQKPWEAIGFRQIGEIGSDDRRERGEPRHQISFAASRRNRSSTPSPVLAEVVTMSAPTASRWASCSIPTSQLGRRSALLSATAKGTGPR